MNKTLHTLIYILPFLLCVAALSRVQAQGTSCRATIFTDKTVLCEGNAITLKVSQLGYTYTWYKDGVEISGQKRESLVINAPGNYSVSIDNRLNCNPEDTNSEAVKVINSTKPVADFTFNSGEQCAGSGMQFTSTSTGENLTYIWDFGDQQTGASDFTQPATPIHTYKGFTGESKKFIVTLKVINEAGCDAVVSKEITIGKGADASLEELDLHSGDTPFIFCSTNPVDIAYTLKVRNISSTPELNKEFAIDWGDGSQENFGASFESSSHTYSERGVYDLVFTVTGNNGCTSSTMYKVYNGSKPSIAIGNPGNTMGCAPQTYTFPISSVEDNSPGTKYFFQFDDGSAPYTYTQENLPANITHIFTTASCEKTNGSFTLTGRAENPCGESTVVVSSIRIAAKPVVDFSSPKDSVCLFETVVLDNKTINGSTITNTGKCDRTSIFHWSIEPATDWVFAPGSSPSSFEPGIIFSKPGKYRVTLTSSNSCGDDHITKYVYVIDPPTAAFTIGASEVCKSTAVATSNASTGDKLTYTWAISPATGYTLASGNLNSKNPVFNFTAAGKYTITLTAANPCNSSSTSQEVNIMDQPSAELPPDKSYCSAQTIKFDASNPAHKPVFSDNNSPITSYNWVLTGGASFVNGTTESSANPEIAFPVNGTYSVAVQAINACGASVAATQSITIFIVDNVTDNTITGDQTLCSNTIPVKLSGPEITSSTGSFSYSWEYSTTSATAGFQRINNAADREFTPDALTETTWFRRVAKAGGCEIPSNAVQLTVNPSPEAPLVAGAAVCSGNTAELKVENPDALCEWFSDENSSTPIHTGTTYLLPVLQATTTYYVQSKNTLGCPSARTPVTITIEPPLTANSISQDQELCIGATPTELQGSLPQGGNGSYLYLWESSTTGKTEDFAPAEGNNQEIHYTPGGISQTTWFRRLVTAGPCWQIYSNPVLVTVTAPITNNYISTPQAVCEGTQPAPLKGTTPAGGNGSHTIVWESSTTGPNGTYAPAAGTNNQQDYAPGQLTVTTWFRRAIFESGCANVSAVIQISVVQPLSDNNISSDQLICLGTVPASLKGTSPKGGSGTYSYQWEISTDNTAFTLAPGTSNEATYHPGPLTQDTWFRRTVTGGTCAELVSNVVKVTVMQPVSNNHIASPQRICAGTAPAKLTGSFPSGGKGSFTYLWEWSSISATDGFSPAPGANNLQDYEPEKLYRNTWFRRKVILPPCQENIGTAVLVTVDPQPVAPEVAGGITCPGGVVKLTAASTITGYVFEWYSQETGGIILHKGKTYTTDQLLATTDYYVQTKNQFGCASERIKVTATVTQPSADAGEDITIVQNRGTQLMATGGETYFWSPAFGLSDPHIANPVANPQETTTYTVTVSTKEGCTFTDEVTVSVLPQIKIPNAITLNGDGINDTWHIENIQHYPKCRVQIFTRWGTTIFDSEGYPTPWDGTNRGQPLPMAAYYYIIDLGVEEDPLAGSITLIK